MMRTPPVRHGRRCVFLIACVLAPLTAAAGIDDVLEAIKQSEFSFARATSAVPFFPVGWLQDSHYPAATFEDDGDVRPPADVTENTLGMGVVLPAYVGKRDMVLAGGDIGWDRLSVDSGPYEDQRILRVTPVVAGLHQFGERETVGVFIAPIFSHETRAGETWSTSGYGGIVGMHWYSDQFQLLYGGIYEDSFGLHSLYPYLGVQWLPTPQLSVALVAPWPTITYAPNPQWIVQLAIAPGGSSWVQRGENFENVQTFGSWNLTANVAHRLHGSLWLSAGAGAAGFRGLTVTSGAAEARFEAKPSPVFTLALQFRP
jgi:hypothetical protein